MECVLTRQAAGALQSLGVIAAICGDGSEVRLLSDPCVEPGFRCRVTSGPDEASRAPRCQPQRSWSSWTWSRSRQ
eukprot:1946689-Rhodomonas_salina.1